MQPLACGAEDNSRSDVLGDVLDDEFLLYSR